MRPEPFNLAYLVEFPFRTLTLSFICLVTFLCPLERQESESGQETLSYSPNAQAKPQKRYNRRQREAKKLIEAGHPTVELNLKTSPNVKASVYHGKEFLGSVPLRLTWPKDTGALDLTLKASGYLTVNTRIYTYRDDRVTVNMFKVDEAHKLFGYKKKVKSSSAESTEE